MKNLIFILLFSIVSSVYAQDTLTYYVSKNGKETSKENAVGTRTVIKSADGTFKVKDAYLDGQFQMTGAYLTDSLKKKTGPFEHYFKDGTLKSKSTYKNNKENGNTLAYFESGELKSTIDFVQGKKHGKLITYWKNGTTKREDQFINGNFVEGICYDETGTEIEHFPFMIMPIISKEKNAINQFLVRNVTYPSKAKSQGIQGRVFVNFTVGKNGVIRGVHIIRAAHPLLNKEALRVVNAMPTWIPGKQDGEPVSVSYNLPITFKLRDTGVKAQNLQSIKYYKKGNKFMNNEDYKKAIGHFTTSINSDPKNKNAYYNRGLCYAKINDLDNACKDWNKCAELGDKEVQKNIAKYCK